MNRFFESEEEVDDMVKNVFGIAPASEAGKDQDKKCLLAGQGEKCRLPEALETFEDKSSDEGISQMAFYGIGQVMLKKSDEATPAAYQVRKESF